MHYEMDFDGLLDLQASVARNPQVVQEELAAAVTEADLLLTREVQDAMPRASGLLAQSVFHEEQVSESGAIGVVATPLIYAAPVELGTKPHFPPIEPLIDWVKVKLGITGDKEARGVAFLIARKISRVGTKEQRPFGLVFQAHESQVDEIFSRAVGRIAARMAGG